MKTERINTYTEHWYLQYYGKLRLRSPKHMQSRERTLETYLRTKETTFIICVKMNVSL